MTVRRIRARRLGAQAKRIANLETLVGELVNVQEGMQRTLKADLTINANGPRPAEPLPTLSCKVRVAGMEIEMEGSGVEQTVIISRFCESARDRGLHAILDNLKADQENAQRKLDHALRPQDNA